MDADWGPAPLQQDLDVSVTKRPEFVDDPREELWVSCNALLDAGHANEHPAESVFIENRAKLFKAVHSHAFCFVGHDQTGRVRNRFDPALAPSSIPTVTGQA